MSRMQRSKGRQESYSQQESDSDDDFDPNATPISDYSQSVAEGSGAPKKQGKKKSNPLHATTTSDGSEANAKGKKKRGAVSKRQLDVIEESDDEDQSQNTFIEERKRAPKGKVLKQGQI